MAPPLFWSASGGVRDRLDYLGIFKRLQTAGYQGGYDAVRRYIRRWKQRQPAVPPTREFSKTGGNGAGLTGAAN